MDELEYRFLAAPYQMTVHELITLAKRKEAAFMSAMWTDQKEVPVMAVFTVMDPHMVGKVVQLLQALEKDQSS
jgi:hypothetical protein